MPTVVVEPQLYSRVEKAAQEHKADVEGILAEAIRQYLWELDRRKISEESQIYRQCHAELETYFPLPPAGGWANCLAGVQSTSWEVDRCQPNKNQSSTRQ